MVGMRTIGDLEIKSGRVLQRDVHLERRTSLGARLFERLATRLVVLVSWCRLANPFSPT